MTASVDRPTTTRWPSKSNCPRTSRRPGAGHGRQDGFNHIRRPAQRAGRRCRERLRRRQRVTDIAIEDAGEWSQRPGHVVWIGLFEPSTELLAAGAGAARPALSGHRGCRQSRTSIPRSSNMARRCSSSRAPPRSIDGRIAFGETHLFVGPRLRGVGAPRRLDLLRRGARALRVLPDGPFARRRLHPLRHPRFHRRQLHAGAGNDPRGGRGHRGHRVLARAGAPVDVQRLYMLRRDLLRLAQRRRRRWSRSAAGSSMPR